MRKKEKNKLGKLGTFLERTELNIKNNKCREKEKIDNLKYFNRKTKFFHLKTSPIGNRAITLVSLVVTVIVLIILTGISINMTLGENGILKMARRAKENMELAQLEEQERLNELYMQIENEEGSSGGEISYDIIAKLNEFKKKIADYIEEAGGIKPEYIDSTETFGERIKGIVANVTKETNAEEMQILTGYKAYSKGKIRIGSMTNQGAKTAILNAGESYTIPQGYHNGDGKITAKDLASQTQGSATAGDILEGKTAWVNGKLIQGIMANSNISPKYNASKSKDAKNLSIAGLTASKKGILIFQHETEFSAEFKLIEPKIENGTVIKLGQRSQSMLDGKNVKTLYFYYWSSNSDTAKFTAGGNTDNSWYLSKMSSYLIEL